ncbi:MAG: hypothetical protein ACK5IJ_06110 [Mangrovibacterium sp.]
MKKSLMLIPALTFLSCSSIKKIDSNTENIPGVYFLESDKLFQTLSDKNYSKIVFQEDGTYKLHKAEILFTPVVEQCDYASKGKWSVVADNVIEITSEDYYSEQQGFKCDIKKENKLSQDSLYIQVFFPTDFHPVNLNFTFNHKSSKSITTDKTYIVLPKSEYLWNRRTATNQISFNLNAIVAGTEIYKSRILFKIFDDSIDTEKYNYFTITLPNFDRCFFEFESYYQELIYIKGRNQLLWRGEIWRK